MGTRLQDVNLAEVLAKVIARYKELAEQAIAKMPADAQGVVKAHVTQELLDKLFAQAMAEFPGLVQGAIGSLQAQLVSLYVTKKSEIRRNHSALA